MLFCYVYLTIKNVIFHLMPVVQSAAIKTLHHGGFPRIFQWSHSNLSKQLYGESAHAQSGFFIEYNYLLAYIQPVCVRLPWASDGTSA